MERPARTVGLLLLCAAVLTAGAPSVITIRPGDTLSALALRHDTTVAKLKAANKLRDTTIYAGELLKIPGSATPAAPPRSKPRLVDRVYTVRAGDNLTRLAKRFGTTPQALKQHNRLRTSTVYIGQHLIYGVKVAAAPSSGPRISSRVARSAAHHRAILRKRTLPSKAVVRKLIVASAKRHGVPVPFALAVAYHESGFQQRVVSPVDAIGVMQVLPSTGRALGRMHGRHYNLLKTTDNIEAGVTLLKDLLNATDSQPKTMAGYYQGLGSIRRVGVLPQTKTYIKNVTVLQRRFS